MKEGCQDLLVENERNIQSRVNSIRYVAHFFHFVNLNSREQGQGHLRHHYASCAVNLCPETQAMIYLVF